MALVAAVLLAAGVAGCGDDGDSTSTGDAAAAGKAATGEGEGSGGSGSTGKSGTGKPTDDSGSAGGGGGSSDDGGGSGGSGEGSGGGSTGSGKTSGGSKDFLTPGGDNSVQTFGAEAGDGDRAAASATVEAFMAGRASGDWVAVCEQMAQGTVEPIEKLLARGQGCVATLTTAGSRLPESALANTMNGPIDSFRVEGNRGFALWHGNDDVDYVLPMKMEGDWKVALLEPTEIF